MAIKFDLSEIVIGGEIVKATLTLKVDNNGQVYNTTRKLHSINKNWSENNVSWNLSSAIENTAIAQNTASPQNSMEIFDITKVIKSILLNGATNNGFMVVIPFKQSSHYKNITYASSEATEVSSRPKLTIEYKPPTAIISNQFLINRDIWVKTTRNKISFFVPTAGTYTATITNAMGKLVFGQNNIKAQQWFTANPKLSSGIHILTIVSPKGTTSKKIIINK